MTLKYCKDCKWSAVAKEPYEKLFCTNPKVNAKDSWELSRMTICGKACSEERGNTRWFGQVCGITGKLFDPKPQKPAFIALLHTDPIVDYL